MKRILILSFLTLTSITLLAQTKDVKVLVKGAIVWSSIPQAVVDKKTKKKIILWGNTENNSWHDNIGMVGNVPVCKDFESLSLRQSMQLSTRQLPTVPCAGC